MNENQNVATQVAAEASQEAAKPSKFLKGLKKAAKWTGIAVVVGGVGALGYFGAQKYLNRSE